MVNIDTNIENNGDFANQVRQRAEQKIAEYNRLVHELEKAKTEMERAKTYLEKLNEVLIAEGQTPMKLREPSSTAFGKPGNRREDFPVRRVEWQGMTVNEIISEILNKKLNTVYHPRDVAKLIYEINTDLDLKMVMRNVRSTMQKGAREGLWIRSGRAKFKSKEKTEQGKLVTI